MNQFEHDLAKYVGRETVDDPARVNICACSLMAISESSGQLAALLNEAVQEWPEELRPDAREILRAADFRWRAEHAQSVVEEDPEGGDGAPPSLILRTHQQRIDSALAPVEIVVEGILEAGQIGAMIALPNQGKSLMAAEMARCVASGDYFAGHRTRRGRVIYACTDSPASTEARLASIDEQTADWILTACDLLIPKQLEMVADACREHECRLLVIDTWDSTRHHATGGYTDVDAGLEDLMRQLRKMAAELRAAVLITHHATRQDGGRARGSVVFDARADWIGHVQQDGQTVSVTSTKCRDGEKGRVGVWNIATTPVGHRRVPYLEWDEEASAKDAVANMSLEGRILSTLEEDHPSGRWSCDRLALALSVSKGGSLTRALQRLRNAGKLDGFQVVRR